MEESYTLRSPEEAAVVLDLRRVRILLAFREPKTAAEVARELGMPPNRVGHHVREFLRLGLLLKVGRSGRRVLLVGRASRYKVPFSLTPYADLNEAVELAVAEIARLVHQAMNRWHLSHDEEFLVLGDDVPVPPSPPVRLIEGRLGAEDLALVEGLICRLSQNEPSPRDGKLYSLGLILVPLE